MKIYKKIIYFLILTLGINIYSQFVYAHNKVSNENVPYKLDIPNKMMGLHPMTEEELKLQEETAILSEAVDLNDLALERINEERREKGMEEVYYDTVEFGEETITNKNDIMLFSEQNRQELPEKVDNMVDVRTANCFPEAGNQGDFNSCGAFSSTYYQMTYMNAFAKGYDVKNDPDKILSPKFTYNIGKKVDNTWDGIWPITAYDIVKKHGCPFNSVFPYSYEYDDPSNFLAWPTEYDIWEDALDNKVKDCGYGNIGMEDEDTPITSPDDPDLELIKKYLANGYVLNIVTYYDVWGNQQELEDGRFLCTSVGNDGEVMHAMTVVGYDDTIYYDINQNETEDAGEFGAFKIINSFGADDVYETWFAYDALNAVSSVNTPETDAARQKGWVNNNEFTWVTMYGEYTPKLLAEFDIKTSNRGSIKLDLGYSSVSESDSTETWKPYIFNNTKYNNFTGNNNFSIGGSENEETAHIVLDYTDLIDENKLDEIDEELKWYISSNANISNFIVEDVFGETYYSQETLPNDNECISAQMQLPLKVDSDKVWDILVNYPLNSNTVNSDTIAIKGINGEVIPSSIEFQSGNNIKVTPIEKYTPNQYYSLDIYGLKTLAGNEMPSSISKRFFVPADNIEEDEFSIEDDFTDSNFLQAIRELVNKPDGYIYWSDVRGIKELNITDENLSSLDGIEYFTSLEQLDCSHNNLTELDLSWNIKLKKLNVLYNELTTLDLSRNSLLTELMVDDDVIVTY